MTCPECGFTIENDEGVWICSGCGEEFVEVDDESGEPELRPRWAREPTLLACGHTLDVLVSFGYRVIRVACPEGCGLQEPRAA